MGLKENFSQAVRELTGGAKDDDKKKNAQVTGLKRALGEDNDYHSQNEPEGQRFIEGTSQPYYRPKADGQGRPSEQPYYRNEPQNMDSYENRGYDPERRMYNNQDDYNNDYDRERNAAYDRGQNAGYDRDRNDGYNRNANAGYDRDRNDGYNRNANANYDRDRNDGYNRNANAGYDRDRNDGYNRNANAGYDDRNRDARPYQDGRQGPDNRQRDTYPMAGPGRQRSFFGQQDNEQDNELTVISANTIVDGNVRSFANMSIDGDIKGDVETTKDIELNGRIVGNITCNNANMIVSQVQGNVLLKGNVEIGRDTLLIGDLTSGFASINGKVKGNVEIAGKAEFRADAVIFGDISASTITVDDGAIIQGYVSTTFLNKEESANIFPEAVSIRE